MAYHAVVSLAVVVVKGIILCLILGLENKLWPICTTSLPRSKWEEGKGERKRSGKEKEGDRRGDMRREGTDACKLSK